MIEGSVGKVERDIGKNCVLEALNLTKFWEPQLEIFRRSELMTEAKAVRDSERTAEDGGDLKEDEMCRVESSANACKNEEVE